jgi:uncharacterized membrane protein
MKGKTCFVMLLLFLWMPNFIKAQTNNPKKASKIYLSAHAPMWGANIDILKKRFYMMSNDGTAIEIKIKIIYSQKSKNTIVIKSQDSKLAITLNKKKCDCPYDIPENESSQWQAKMILNTETFMGCAYFD